MFSSCLRNSCAGVAIWFVLLISTGVARAGDTQTPGRELFDREWLQNDPLSGNGDGLGPMFNARSCAACHHQQGSGGGGGTQHNVDLLTLVDFNGSGSGPSRSSLEKLHPGFRTANSVTLHALSNQQSYGSYRSALLGTGRPKIRSVSVKRNTERGRDLIEWGAFLLQQSQRNTPSLFGAGLIDKISDAALAELEKENLERLKLSNPTEQAGGSRGRFGGFGFGRSAARSFGWKGQTPTLKAFVAGACANELGLQAKGNPQAPDVTNVAYRRDRVDMTAGQLDALVGYVASLPPPKRWDPSSHHEAESMTRGALLFGQAKCQTCHIQDVENVRGIYSDLQLHDMGKGLSDPTGRALTTSTPRGIPARPVKQQDYNDPDLVVTPEVTAGSSAPYYGPTIVNLAATWRTPPLWGVRDSAPYMHDGRAATLDEAIKWHDGEAADSAARYRKMSPSERHDLVMFVYSLGAP